MINLIKGSKMFYATLKEAVNTNNTAVLDINELEGNKRQFFLDAIDQDDLYVVKFLISKSTVEELTHMIFADNYQLFKTLLAEEKIGILKSLMDNIYLSQTHRPILESWDLVMEYVTKSQSKDIIEYFVSITNFEAWQSFCRYPKYEMNHEPTTQYLESLNIFLNIVQGNNNCSNIEDVLDDITIDMVNKALEWCDSNNKPPLESLKEILEQIIDDLNTYLIPDLRKLILTDYLLVAELAPSSNVSNAGTLSIKTLLPPSL